MLVGGLQPQRLLQRGTRASAWPKHARVSASPRAGCASCGFPCHDASWKLPLPRRCHDATDGTGGRRGGQCGGRRTVRYDSMASSSSPSSLSAFPKLLYLQRSVSPQRQTSTSQMGSQTTRPRGERASWRPLPRRPPDSRVCVRALSPSPVCECECERSYASGKSGQIATARRYVCAASRKSRLS